MVDFKHEDIVEATKDLSLSPYDLSHYLVSKKCNAKIITADKDFRVRIDPSDSPLHGRARVPFQGVHSSHIDSGLCLSFGGQSGRSESPPKGGLSWLGSNPLKERGVTAFSSYRPIKPSIKLGRGIISITKRNFGKEVFKHRAIYPRW